MKQRIDIPRAMAAYGSVRRQRQVKQKLGFFRSRPPPSRSTTCRRSAVVSPGHAMTGGATVATRLSVLVPVYNNERDARGAVSRCDQALQGFDYEVLLVNDGSRDRSLGT